MREIITLYEEKRNLRTGYHRNSAKAVALYAAESSGEPPYTEHSKLERNRMREIMDYLEHNYMNKIQMKDIAEEIHLCESECSRLFKRYMNVSLFTFLQEYRVERSLNFSSAPMTASWKSPRNPASQTPTTMPRYSPE